MAQLSQTFPRKNWKTLFLNEDQKLNIKISPVQLEKRKDKTEIIVIDKFDPSHVKQKGKIFTLLFYKNQVTKREDG